MNFIGTHMEYLEVTRLNPDGSTTKHIDMALMLPILKGDPSVIEVISAETGEVFFKRGNGITILM